MAPRKEVAAVALEGNPANAPIVRGLSQDAGRRVMGMEMFWAAIGAAVLVALLFVERKTGVTRKSEALMSGLLRISETTPGWLAFLKLLWIWTANAVGSLVLWILAVPGSGGSASFYRLGWFFLAGNAVGIVVTTAYFAAGRRAEAVEKAKWVVPVIFVALLVYALLESKVV
jgi:hypothetical protein